MEEEMANWREELSGLRKDWEVIERILPAGWEAQERQSRAYVFSRGIGSAATLLRILLIHLSDGCSLRDTGVRAREGGLAAVSDVALLKRLRHCGVRFGWMVQCPCIHHVRRHAVALEREAGSCRRGARLLHRAA
jgi:hypothetical protein